MNTRDLGLNHSPGKGDKPRSKFDANWHARFDEIDWKRNDAKGDDGFRKRGNKRTKSYGAI